MGLRMAEIYGSHTLSQSAQSTSPRVGFPRNLPRNTGDPAWNSSAPTCSWSGGYQQEVPNGGLRAEWVCTRGSWVTRGLGMGQLGQSGSRDRGGLEGGEGTRALLPPS